MMTVSNSYSKDTVGSGEGDESTLASFGNSNSKGSRITVQGSPLKVVPTDYGTGRNVTWTSMGSSNVNSERVYASFHGQNGQELDGSGQNASKGSSPFYSFSRSHNNGSTTRMSSGMTDVCLGQHPVRRNGSGTTDNALLTSNNELWLNSNNPNINPNNNSTSSRQWRFSCKELITVLGPGLMTMLADTDGPCLITAAASGSEFGYSLVGCQLLLIPILYAAQELTVRLALSTNKGLTELIRLHFGKKLAIGATLILAFTCVAAIISEMSVIAQVGKLWGLPVIVSSFFCFCLLSFIVLTGTFRQVEIIGCILGSCQLLFIPVMFLLKPDWGKVLGREGLLNWDFTNRGWMELLAANIGAVIMPWMLYYQQSAICERRTRNSTSINHMEKKDVVEMRSPTSDDSSDRKRGLLDYGMDNESESSSTTATSGSGSVSGQNQSDCQSYSRGVNQIDAHAIPLHTHAHLIAHLIPLHAQNCRPLEGVELDKAYFYGKIDTGIGSILTQIVMSSMVIAMGKSIYMVKGATTLKKLEEIVEALSPTLGPTFTKIIVSLGTTGACMVAAIVVSICPAWSLCECFDIQRSLDRKIRDAYGFYSAFFGVLICSLIVTNIPEIGDSTMLSIQVEILNALLMPVVVGFIFFLATKKGVLPEDKRLKGPYMWILGITFTICSLLCFYATVVDCIDILTKKVNAAFLQSYHSS